MKDDPEFNINFVTLVEEHPNTIDHWLVFTKLIKFTAIRISPSSEDILANAKW